MAKAKRVSPADNRESIVLALAGARAAVLTATLAIEHRGGVDWAIAFTLWRSALLPIDEALGKLEVRHGG